MPVGPANAAIRIATADILSRFLSDYGWRTGRLATLRDKVYGTYRPGHLSPDALHAKLKDDQDLRLRDQHLFLYLEPTQDEKILPLVTLQSSEEWVHFRAYALLTMLDEACTLRSLAMRFETDEGSEGPGAASLGSHDFCHAQLCRGISSRALSSIPWVPDSQPSLPLDADDQVSLVLCMLTTLYGGSHVLSKIGASGERRLRGHLSRIRALRTKLK